MMPPPGAPRPGGAELTAPRQPVIALSSVIDNKMTEVVGDGRADHDTCGREDRGTDDAAIFAFTAERAVERAEKAATSSNINQTERLQQ